MPVSILTKTDFSPKSLAEARRHFAKKAAVTSDAFEKLSEEAKAHAFRVATVHKARLIQDIRDKVAAAIDEGTSWSDVQRDLLKLLDTGGVPRPALHKLRTMFLMNTQQAYNDARRETLDDPEITEAFPFREYLTVGNGTAGINGVRATHAALHGRIFRWDDPFWDAHTPPWEWGCRCTFVALTAGQVRALGVKVVDLDYVRKRSPVPGTERKGIAENTKFARGKFDLKAIDAELREAVLHMLKEKN